MESLADAHCVDLRSGCSSENLYNSPMGVQDCSKKSNAAGEWKGKVEGLVGGQTTLADVKQDSKQLKFPIAAAKNDSSNAQNASKKASELAGGLTAKDETRVDSPPPFDARKFIKELRQELGVEELARYLPPRLDLGRGLQNHDHDHQKCCEAISHLRENYRPPRRDGLATLMPPDPPKEMNTCCFGK